MGVVGGEIGPCIRVWGNGFVVAEGDVCYEESNAIVVEVHGINISGSDPRNAIDYYVEFVGRC